MSSVLKFADVRETLASIIGTKDVLLVIGAGASVSSGAPLTRDLVQRLAVKFPLGQIPMGMSLFDACREVEDTPAYGHQDLVRFVHAELADLQPSESYKQLPRVRWRGIFTTNYDDLIEKAYTSPARVQTLQPVPLEFRGQLTPRDNHVQFHYLMGSVKEKYGSPGVPVLTWGDYTRTLQARVPVMELFKNVLADGGKVIYVGYSFNDLVFEGILDEALNRLGHRDVPYGHAILTEWPEDRRRGYQRISMRKVVPVEGSFEEFAELLREVADGGHFRSPSPLEPPSSPASGTTLTVRGQEISLTESEASVYSEAFDILNDATTYQPKLEVSERTALARSFFRGAVDLWAPYALGLPYRRPSTERVLASVLERINRGARTDNILLVHGPAALGKSVMARQIAYELFTQHDTPVILVKARWRARPDMKLLDRLLDDMTASVPESAPLPPVVIVIDEAELMDRLLPGRLASFLRSRHRQFVLVLLARTNEYFRSEKANGKPDSPIGEYVGLDDRMEPQEIRALMTHLIQIGLWDNRRTTDERFWQELIAADGKPSFFDTVYRMVEDTQQSLVEGIISEYGKLSPVAQRAYILIASVHQFGLPMKMEILMRALEVDFPTFESQIIKSDALKILFSEHASDELNIYYRGRTRLISKIVFEHALPEATSQLPVFMQFAKSVNPSEMFGADELDTLRTLLIQVLGPGGHDRRFSSNELAELFAVATAVVQDDVLEHHFGIVERDAGRLSSARQHFLRALELSSTLPDDLAAVRESIQNIENSLAKVIGMMASQALSKGDSAGAAVLFDEAREHFINARSGAFPNAAAYDAHARMLLARARGLHKQGSADRALDLTEVLDVVADGVDNVNEDYKADLVALQTDIMEELGLAQEARDELTRRVASASPRERARYELLLARLELRGSAADAKRKRLRAAFALAARACESDPQYFPALRMRAELHHALHPVETEEFVKYLEAAMRTPEGANNNWVLYEMAVGEFQLTRYEQSFAAFKKLMRVSAGNTRGTASIERAGERGDKEPFVFNGRVVRSEERGRYFIKSDDLAAFGEIFFNTRGERFYTARVGDMVEFVVGFTYKGIVAAEVRRL
jgi:hypothetical protein